MRTRLALLIAVCLAGCGGEDRQREQLRPGELTTLSARVVALRDAILAGERIPALDAVTELRETVDELSPRLAPDEERALRLAVRRVSARVRADIPPPADGESPEAEEESLIPLPDEDGADEKPGKGNGKGKGKKKGKD